jgi:hypothetical protein
MIPKPKKSPAKEPAMLELAQELYDEEQCSSGWRHWTRAELENYCRRAAQLAELILERESLI